MSGLRSRRKGVRTELNIMHYIASLGFGGVKKLSRAGYTGPDLSLPLLGMERFIEVKCRANGFASLYKWLERADYLVVKADHERPLVVLRLDDALKIAFAADASLASPADAESSPHTPPLAADEDSPDAPSSAS